jgi:hypothetical protein
MRQSLAIANLYEGITKDVKLTEQDLLASYKEVFEKIKASYLRFPQEEIKNKPKAEEKKAAQLAAETALKNIKEALAKKPKSNFKDIIKGLGLKIEETPLIGRSDFIPGLGLSDEFTKTAFSLKPEEISPVVSINGYFYIIRNDEFVPVSMESFNKEKEAFKEKLLETKKEEKFSAYFSALKNSAQLEDNIKRPTETAAK